MSTNPNTQQTNVFNKGMNTDTSDAFLENEQYRYAENVRFFTNTGENSGELRAIEGWNEIEGLFKSQEEIKAVASIRDYIIVLSNDPKGQLHVINTVSKKEVHFDLTDIILNEGHLSIVTQWEDDDNIKIYIVNGDSDVQAFKFDSTKDNIAEDNIITKINAQDKAFSFAGFTSVVVSSGGSMKPAIVQYAYILYNKYGGTSVVSPLTSPISLYNRSTYHNGVMDGQYANINVKLVIGETSSTTDFERIKLYRITYQQIDQLPTIDLIADQKLGVTEFTFTDYGQTPITADTSFAEFKSYEIVDIKPKLIESKDNYLFGANVKYNAADDYMTVYNEWAAGVKSQPESSLLFTEDYGNELWSFTGNSNVQWELKDDKQIEINDSHGNSDVYKSLRRDEIYRYGIVLYDARGHRWPVIHIADIRTPPCWISNPFAFHDNKTYANVLYVRFKILNLDTKFFPNYEIVRCKRTLQDSATVCQGIIGKAIHNLDSVTEYYPSGFLTLGTVRAESGSDYGNLRLTTQSSRLCQFASPETVYTDVYDGYIKANIDGLYLNVINAYNTIYNETTKSIYSPINKVDYDTNVIQFGDDGLYVSYITPDATYSGELGILLHNPLSTNPYTKNFVVGTETYNDTIYTKTIQNVIKVSSINENLPSDIEIKNVAKIDIVNPTEYKFATKDGTLLYKDNTFTINEKQYINWSMPGYESINSLDPSSRLSKNVTEILYRYFDSDDGTEGNAEWFAAHYPVGTGGTCLLFDTGVYPIGQSGGSRRSPAAQIKPDARCVYVANIRNDNVIPYGGLDNKLYSQYVSFGSFFETQQNPEYESVFDGDCYLQNFYYTALHSWDDPFWVGVLRMSTVYIVPLETNIDMDSDYGMSYKRNQTKEIQDVAFKYRNYSQDKDAYMYNTAFSSEPITQTSTSIEEDDIQNNQYDCRVIYSDQKQNNEKNDSWLKFRAANYIDVDTKYGPITGLKKFKNQLIFWQKDAMGVLSVNERTMLQDVNDTNIILGNGDVLQRFDYITTEYGMAPNQNAYTESDSTLYWWDKYRKEILAYSGGQQVLPLKVTKQISNFINEREPNEHPVLAYDNKYKEVLANVVKYDNNENAESYPIVYSEIAQYFTALYKTPFKYSTTVNGQLLLFKDREGYQWNAGSYNLEPCVKYIVNKDSAYVKVFDNVSFGLGDGFYRFYNSEEDDNIRQEDALHLEFKFNTPHEQKSTMSPVVTDREYDFRFAIPRDQNATSKPNIWGGRMRGKTMQCEITAKDNFDKFSLQYIITKYRISWS